MNWVFFALLACITNTIFLLLFAYLIRERFENVSSIDITAYLCIILGIIGIVVLFFKRDNGFALIKKNMDKKTIVIIAIAIFGALLYCKLKIDAFRLVNNPGYALSIININAVLLIILSYFLFGHKVNKYAFAGVCLLIAGISLILINSKNEKDLEMDILDKIIK